MKFCKMRIKTGMRGENDPKPFIKYMLGIILSCYREFEARIVLAEKTGKKSKAYDVVKTYSENTLGKFSKHDALGCMS